MENKQKNRSYWKKAVIDPFEGSSKKQGVDYTGKKLGDVKELKVTSKKLKAYK